MEKLFVMTNSPLATMYSKTRLQLRQTASTLGKGSTLGKWSTLGKGLNESIAHFACFNGKYSAFDFTETELVGPN